MGRNARKKAEEFSVEKHLDHLEKIYEKVIKKYTVRTLSMGIAGHYSGSALSSPGSWRTPPMEDQSMYAKVMTLIAACLYYSGWVALGRWWMRRQGPRLMILNYHRAGGGDLRRHMLYLHRHYRLQHLEDALEELFSPAAHTVRDRRTPLVITFDDGYYDNYTHCFALARELHIPVTIFLLPGYIETGNHFWWLEPDYLVARACVREVMIEGLTYHLNTSEEREALTRAIVARLRCAASVHEREAFLREISPTSRAPPAVARAEKQDLPMSWVEIETMQKCAWISFGSHTMHHPILASLADPGEVEYEVRKSRAVLERHLETSVRSFAYPVGKVEDIGEQGVHSVQKSGIHVGCDNGKGLEHSSK